MLYVNIAVFTPLNIEDVSSQRKQFGFYSGFCHPNGYVYWLKRYRPYRVLYCQRYYSCVTMKTINVLKIATRNVILRAGEIAHDNLHRGCLGSMATFSEIVFTAHSNRSCQLALFSLTGFIWSDLIWSPKENYMQDMTKILHNMQCLLLGVTDLTLNPWALKKIYLHRCANTLVDL